MGVIASATIFKTGKFIDLPGPSQPCNLDLIELIARANTEEE